MKKIVSGLMVLTVVLLIASPARADLRTGAVRETAKYLLRKFGKEAAEEGLEGLAKKIAASAARHGDDVITAVRKVGPRALRLADEAGGQGARAVRLMARHGDDAAVWVISRPKAMGLLARYGDDAAEAMIRHRGVAEPLLEGFGRPAVQALGKIGPQNGRRLAMLAKGELAAMGHTPELLGVIGKYGDPAMDFIWRHKGVLAGGAALTAFLANPQPYLNGTNQLAGTIGENFVRPAVEAAGNVAQEAAGFVRWTLTILVLGLAAGLGLAVKSGALEKPWVRAAAHAAGRKIGKRAVSLFARK
jgi:hypothetical protein